MREKGVSNIDILLVAYNHGYQDKWIVRNAYKIPATVSMGVGRTFALLTGYQPKDPVYIENLNLSWLYRLFTQPARYKRILKAFPLFPIKLYENNLKQYINSQ
jgi:N-acetylglucosaminyldiphosphoundecaprenol N-acetyl-beta-D-mannosaminyltransferase